MESGAGAMGKALPEGSGNRILLWSLMIILVHGALMLSVSGLPGMRASWTLYFTHPISTPHFYAPFLRPISMSPAIRATHLSEQMASKYTSSPRR